MIEQITYLLFIKWLDDLETFEEREATRLGAEMERRIFPKGKDARKRPYKDRRWSNLRQLEPKTMYEVVSEQSLRFSARSAAKARRTRGT